jgi:hypothetical protein
MNLHSLDHHIDYSFDNFTFPLPKSSSDQIKAVVRDLPRIYPVTQLGGMAKSTLLLLISDIGTGRNQDTTNRISADEILLKIYNILSSNPQAIEISILESQLLEMRTGMCPQGRTIRLLQVLFCMM